MAAVLTTCFPDKAPELFAYRATVVRVDHNYEGKHWVQYNRQFQREALIMRPSLVEPGSSRGGHTVDKIQIGLSSGSSPTG